MTRKSRITGTASQAMKDAKAKETSAPPAEKPVSRVRINLTGKQQ